MTYLISIYRVAQSHWIHTDPRMNEISIFLKIHYFALKCLLADVCYRTIRSIFRVLNHRSSSKNDDIFHILVQIKGLNIPL